MKGKMREETKQTLKRVIGALLAVGVLVLVVYLILRGVGLTNLTREDIQAFIEKQGATAPLIYIAISFIQVTFIPIPASITILAGNFVFGAWEAFLYSYIGMMLGAMLAFALGRWIGKPFVNWVSGGKEKTEEWLQKLHGKENVLLFFMFFFPFFPDDILCTVAGILPISWSGFFWMQVVTRATSTFGTLFFMSGEIIPFAGWGLAVIGLAVALGVVAFVLCFKNAEKINAFFARIGEKLTRKKP